MAQLDRMMAAVNIACCANASTSSWTRSTLTGSIPNCRHDSTVRFPCQSIVASDRPRSVQLRRPIHRRESPTPDAVKDGATQEEP
jgi:hypothetical protein